MLNSKYIVTAWLIAMSIFGAFILIFAQKNNEITQWFNKGNFSELVNLAYVNAGFPRVERLYHEHYLTHPQDTEVAVDYIDALVVNKSIIKASNLIDEIYATFPESHQPTLDLYLGLIEFQKSRFEASIHLFEKASQSTIGEVRLRAEINLAYAYLRTGKFDNVEKQIEILNSFNEEIPEIEEFRIELSQRFHRFEELKPYYERLQGKLQSGNPFGATSLFRANVVVYKMNIEGRNVYLNEKKDLGTKNFILGNSYLKLGYWDKGMAAFKESSSYPSAPALTEYWLGINALHEHDSSGASRYLNSALRKNKDLPFAKEALDAIPN
jgi:tetratricopeptide (TPR) repeat protein